MWLFTPKKGPSLMRGFSQIWLHNISELNTAYKCSFWQHSVQNWQEMYCMKICVEQKSKTCLGSWKIVHNNTAYQVFYHMTR